jgi:solute carrier family 25 iron transporter 28/37
MVASSRDNNDTLQRRMTTKFEDPQEAAKLQRQTTSHAYTIGAAGEHVMELEWEEWDGSGSFTDHCLAGSFAGVAEHTLLYPVDTIKTQMQAFCADCPANSAKSNASAAASAARPPPNGMWNTMKQLTMQANERVVKTASTDISASVGFGRLWRGVQTMMVGCIPAHALYFSSYEAVKAVFLERDNETTSNSSDGQQSQNLGPMGSAVAGATAAFCHDLIMTPADTVKQRQQLGHYDGMNHAIRNILASEGPAGLYRSFPITLLTNLPYGIIMVTTNEYLRELLEQRQSGSPVLDVKTTLLAGSGAGMAAAAVTTPLDRVKTRLQTQGLTNIMAPASCERVSANCPKLSGPKYEGLADAAKSILREEGWMGFFRGMTPRLMTHTPAIAISWTSYEAMKMYLTSFDK